MNNINIVLKNLVLVHEMTDVDGVGKVISDAAAGYGFSYCGLFRRTFTADGQEPRWKPVTHWIHNRPITEIADLSEGEADAGWSSLSAGDAPFTWDSALDAARQENKPVYQKLKSLLERAAAAGITHGMTFPVFSRDGLMGKLALGRTERVELSPVEISLFNTLAAQCLRQCETILQRRESGPVAIVPIPKLSDREILILHSIAAGMTSVETAKAAQISHHTVDWYVNGLQRKLDARNRQNLIAIAFRMGLIR